VCTHAEDHAHTIKMLKFLSEFAGLQKHENILSWVTKRDTVAAGPLRAAEFHSESCDGVKTKDERHWTSV